MMYFAFVQRRVTPKTLVGLADTMAVATLISWTLQRVLARG
jgi:hypothetical protein